MKGYEYVHYMTLKEWQKFAINYNNFKREPCEESTLKAFLMSDYIGFNQFINRSFAWAFTPERRSYWKEISRRKQPLTNSIEKVLLPGEKKTRTKRKK